MGTVTISEERYKELLMIEDLYYGSKNSIESAFNQIHLLYESELTWKDKYEKIFSGGLYRKFTEYAPGFSWYDPDADYEDDVRAFYWAVKEYMDCLH